MAAMVLLNGYSSGSTITGPLNGWLNLDQGRFVTFGRATFPTALSGEITLPMTPAGVAQIDLCLLTAGSIGVQSPYYRLNATANSMTITNAGTNSTGEISFFIAVR